MKKYLFGMGVALFSPSLIAQEATETSDLSIKLHRSISNPMPKAVNIIENNGHVTIDILPTDKMNPISHQKYDSFNVTEKGLTFNNLSKSPADVIISEVVTPNYVGVKDNQLSYIEGNMDITGKPAEIVIVNPYGISCVNECQFDKDSIDKVSLLTDINGEANPYISSNKNILFKNVNLSNSSPIHAYAAQITFSGKVHMDKLIHTPRIFRERNVFENRGEQLSHQHKMRAQASSPIDISNLAEGSMNEYAFNFKEAYFSDYHSEIRLYNVFKKVAKMKPSIMTFNIWDTKEIYKKRK